jgi:hypothetical protein
MRAAVLALVVAMSSGCGLTLDYGPPEPDAGRLGGLDGGVVRIDAASADGDVRDASSIDGGVVVVMDVGGPEDSGNLTMFDADAIDAGARIDAAVVDASLGTDADLDAGPPDAGVPDVGPPDVGLADSGLPDVGPPDAGNDASTFACMGVHPIIGPPRTCNPGSCLCTAIDTCFTSDVARFCCASSYVCAPPPTDCSPTHPIVGPPRTCPSGQCYCANPDACFPMDRAAGCCGVDVICVP